MTKKLDGMVAAAIPLAVAAGGIGQGFANTEEAHKQVRNTERQTTQEIRAGQQVSVFQDGQATVKLKNGDTVTITDPLLVHSSPEGEHDHTIVLERNPNTQSNTLTQGFYGESGGISDHVQAKSISYKFNGRTINADEALSHTTKEAVQLNSLGQFVVAAGQEHAGQVVAAGTTKHK